MARILQIEDNNDIQKILRDFFSEEHEVIQAYSGTEGLRLFEAENIDLVLLDIMLPGKSGEQVLQEIRKVSSVPIIMLTALSDKQMISQYLLAIVRQPIQHLDQLTTRFYTENMSDTEKSSAHSI